MGWDIDVREKVYQRLANEIFFRILRGEYALGAKLPSYIEIAKKAGSSPETLRKAFRELQQQGVIEKTRKAERTSRVSTSIAYEIVRPGCRKDKRDKHGNAPLVCGRSPAKKDGMHSRQNDGAFQTPCLSVSASGRTKKRKGLSGVHLTHFLQQTLAGGGLFLLAHDARLFEVLALLHFRQNASLFHLLLEAAQSDIEVIVVFVQKDSGHWSSPPLCEILSKEGDKKHPA